MNIGTLRFRDAIFLAAIAVAAVGPATALPLRQTAPAPFAAQQSPEFKRAVVCVSALYSETMRIGMFAEPIGAEKDEARITAKREAWSRKLNELLPSSGVSPEAVNKKTGQMAYDFLSDDPAKKPRFVAVIDGCMTNAPKA